MIVRRDASLRKTMVAAIDEPVKLQVCSQRTLGFCIRTATPLLSLALAFVACEERRAPTAPTGGGQPAAISIENITTTTIKRVASLDVPFTYQVSLALRETGGGG